MFNGSFVSFRISLLSVLFILVLRASAPLAHKHLGDFFSRSIRNHVCGAANSWVVFVVYNSISYRLVNRWWMTIFSLSFFCSFHFPMNCSLLTRRPVHWSCALLHSAPTAVVADRFVYAIHWLFVNARACLHCLHWESIRQHKLLLTESSSTCGERLPVPESVCVLFSTLHFFFHSFSSLSASDFIYTRPSQQPLHFSYFPPLLHVPLPSS